MKDEKLYTWFGSIRSGFLTTPVFIFWLLGGLSSLNRMRYVRYVSKNQKFNNLSKTVSLVEIFQREPAKIIKLVKKVVKNAILHSGFTIQPQENNGTFCLQQNTMKFFLFFSLWQLQH
jgi:hypothetical protein